ncbi:hypothetical protein ACFQZ4_52400 [Catellatospora coxensis]
MLTAAQLRPSVDAGIADEPDLCGQAPEGAARHGDHFRGLFGSWSDLASPQVIADAREVLRCYAPSWRSLRRVAASEASRCGGRRRELFACCSGPAFPLVFVDVRVVSAGRGSRGWCRVRLVGRLSALSRAGFFSYAPGLPCPWGPVSWRVCLSGRCV